MILYLDTSAQANVSDAVVRRAGALAERHALRGYDDAHARLKDRRRCRR